MKSILFYLALLLFTFSTSAAQDIQATTSRGERVVLHPDGTWSKAEDVPLLNGGSFTAPVAAKAVLKGKNVKYTLSYDATKWSIQPESSNADADYELVHSEGDGYSIIIAEKVVLSTEVLRQAAIANAREASPDATIAHEDERTVNGHQVRCLKITGTVEGVPVEYYNYYYAGKEGAVQIITFTSQDSFKDYEKDFTDFLNGFNLAK
jgi:hypothetical protein